MPYCRYCGNWLEPGETCSCEAARGAEPAGGEQERGYTDQSTFQQDAGYADQQAFQQDPGYADQQAFQQDPGYADQRAFQQDPGYADQQAFQQDPGYADQRAFQRDPGYPQGGAFNKGMPGQAPLYPGGAAGIGVMWRDFKNRVGLGEPETNDVDYYERGLGIVPQCVDPDSGEIPIKQYNLAVLRTRIMFMRSEGRLQVTNKRVIFRATGRSLMGRIALQHEFAIDEIAGAKIRKDHRLSFFNLLGASAVIGIGGYIGVSLIRSLLNSESTFFPGFIALILMIASLVPFFMLYKMFPLKLFFLSIGGAAVITMQQISRFTNGKGGLWIVPVVISSFLILFTAFVICFVPNLIMEIETKGTQPAVELRRKESSIFNMWRKPEYTGFAEVIPWTDTEQAIIELWAMISDIQKYGDSAIEQWRG